MVELTADEIKEMTRQLALARRQIRAERAERDAAIRAMRTEGATLEEIGRVYGITRQRVLQIVGKRSAREVVDTASS